MTEPTRLSPGRFIALLRAHMRLTQEGFAREIRITVSTINRWENGKAEPSPMAIEKLNTMAERAGFGERLD